MKILQINDKYRLVGGSEKTLLKSAEYLVRAGHEVIIAHGDASQPGKTETDWRAIFVQELANCRPARLNRDALRVLLTLLQQEQPNVVHVRNFEAPFVICALASKVPVVRTVHTIAGYCANGMKYSPQMQRPCTYGFGWRCLYRSRLTNCNIRSDASWIPLSKWIKRIAGCYATGWGDQRVHKLIVTSGYMKRELIMAGHKPDHIAVIPPPLELPASNDDFGNHHNERVVLFVGRMIFSKGVQHLIHAIALLPEYTQLWVVGDGPDKQHSEKLSVDLGLGGRIRFFGWVDYHDIGKIYAKSAVVVVPSLWPEPFGNVGIEAMAYGKPVVAYNVGGISDWLVDGETGYLAAPADAKDLADKIELCLSNPEKAIQMGRTGRQRAETLFSVKEHVAKTLAVYEQAIENFAEQ